MKGSTKIFGISDILIMFFYFKITKIVILKGMASVSLLAWDVTTAWKLLSSLGYIIIIPFE